MSTWRILIGYIYNIDVEFWQIGWWKGRQMNPKRWEVQLLCRPAPVRENRLRTESKADSQEEIVRRTIDTHYDIMTMTNFFLEIFSMNFDSIRPYVETIITKEIVFKLSTRSFVVSTFSEVPFQLFSSSSTPFIHQKLLISRFGMEKVSPAILCF